MYVVSGKLILLYSKKLVDMLGAHKFRIVEILIYLVVGCRW